MLKRISYKKILFTIIISISLLSWNVKVSSQDHSPVEESTHHEISTHQEGDKHSEAKANDQSSEEFNPGEFIIDHVKDSHEWHILTKGDGEHVSVPLPVIVFSKEKGLKAFMSSKLAHGHHYNGFYLENEKILEELSTGEVVAPLDFSMTKTVTGMIVSCIILLLLFVRMGKMYRKEKMIIPSGLNGFLEPMILFIRNDIAIPNIGEDKYERYMPYLLTVFFFILVNNLMGLVPPLIPFGANVTGNIAVTFVLAMFTFIITQFSGNKNYWKHIVASPGVPFWLAPIMIPVEIIGIFSKPFALMVRLFGNITAGHIIVLSLVSLIFIFKSLAIAPVSAAFVLFMDGIEILVAFLQAYVFTLLSALFIGLAVKEHHD